MHIADALEATLAGDFARAADVLEASLASAGDGARRHHGWIAVAGRANTSRGAGTTSRRARWRRCTR